MSDLVKGYTDFVGEEPNGHLYEVYHADDVQEVLQAKDTRIAELEKFVSEFLFYFSSSNGIPVERATIKADSDIVHMARALNMRQTQ